MIPRRANPADLPALSALYAACWDETYRGLAPTPFVEGLTESFRTKALTETLGDPDRFLLLVEREGKAVGFAEGGPERSRPGGDVGEIYSLYLLRAHQAQGLGRALFEAAAQELRGKGKGALAVWVMENLPARGFYERLGGRAVVRDRAIRVGPEVIKMRSYVWDLPSSPPTP